MLAGLLQTVLTNRKATLQAIACRSNVKQWFLAYTLYADDSEDYDPCKGNASEPINSDQNLPAWDNTASTYAGVQKLPQLYALKDIPLPGGKSLYACPTRQSKQPAPTEAAPFFMYGPNSRMDPNALPPPAPPRQIKRAEILQPAETIVFGENGGSYPSITGRNTPARHFKGANLAFGDGHAVLIKTNDYSRTILEDSSSVFEWGKSRRVYLFPFPGATP